MPGPNILAQVRALVGGDIVEYTCLLEEARKHAIRRMVANATVLGVNPVVMMRIDAQRSGPAKSEIVAHGTALVLEPA